MCKYHGQPMQIFLCRQVITHSHVAGEMVHVSTTLSADRSGTRSSSSGNVLFVGSVTGLFTLGATEAVSAFWFAGLVGVSAPTAMF